jgi:hypothetical protein
MCQVRTRPDLGGPRWAPAIARGPVRPMWEYLESITHEGDDGLGGPRPRHVVQRLG